MGCRLAILGSTGSIGTQTLEVVDALNAEGGGFEVVALSGHQNGELLSLQVQRYRPTVVAVTDSATAGEVRGDVTVLSGPNVLADVAARDDVDCVVHAVVGAAGLAATFAAIDAGKRVCLANKESLVIGGRLLMDRLKRPDQLLPVDSEHSAIFQALQCGGIERVQRAILTASGGPFRDAREWPADRLARASVAEALAHPTWRMGGKITIDSATLFNKALEFIEAVQLFGLPAEQVEVVVHPQSVVHSMVEYVDGSTVAQLSPPDMRLPIAYTLTYPDRLPGVARRMDWTQAQTLHFEPPDEMRFPALRLAREAATAGGSAPLTLNAANEVAVGRFLNDRLSFGGIGQVVEATMAKVPVSRPESLADLLAADAESRRVAETLADAAA